LLQAIDRQSAIWVAATYRVSPQLTVELSRIIGGEFVKTMKSVEPMEVSRPVNLAGPGPVPAWMQIAREYTEYWVNQQHIRDAVGKRGLTDCRMYFPVLDTFVRAIPYTLRNTVAADKAVIQLAIAEEAVGIWSARRSNDSWDLIAEHGTPTTSVPLDQDLP
jgi:hypothetical protein